MDYIVQIRRDTRLLKTFIKFKNRDELKALIEKCGGKVTGSVTTKTSFLINNDINSNSAKNVAAQRLNIPILTEEEFLNMVGK